MLWLPVFVRSFSPHPKGVADLVGTHSDDLLLSPLHSDPPQSCYPQAAEVTQYWRTPVSNQCCKTYVIFFLSFFFFKGGFRGA